MEKCVVRRAIKEAKTEKIIGYELFFQSGSDDLYQQTETGALDAISEFFMNNSGKIFKDKQIFITLTPSLLFRNTARLFEKDKVIIQVGDNLIIHPLAMPLVKKYHGEGYKLAINDFQFSPKYFSFLEYADYIRLEIGENMTETEISSVNNIMDMARGFGKKCIATGLDTKGAYDQAVALGADYLEGTYIAETLITKADKVTYMQGNFFQLVVAVAKEEPDMTEIEEIIERDAGLSYAILKLVNSAYFALRRRTASIRQALMTLGIGQLRQWVYMLSVNNDDSDGNAEMLKLSFLRATLAQELATRLPSCPISKTEAYMMGMFSTLGYMVDASLEELLAEIPIREEVKNALLKGEGETGKLYNLIISYEKADWAQCIQIAKEANIKISELSQLYINCVEEVNSIWENLTTDFARPDEPKDFNGVTGGEAGQGISSALL